YIDQTTTVHTYKTTTPINFNPKDFLLLIPPQTRSTLFPYTTLFRSNGDDIAGFQRVVRRQIAFLQDVPEIHVVAPRFLVRLPVKHCTVGRSEVGQAAGLEHGVEHAHARAEGQAQRIVDGAGDAHPRQELMAVE